MRIPEITQPAAAPAKVGTEMEPMVKIRKKNEGGI
jgi:hypothetical protein